ncbi:hypothetical protein GIB67_025474 [Kingdonia uniflora]|uniref:Transcription factor GTE4 n=1 Tax=Kingdonia uniflora TaxID=39325 RepID=A0A7J7PCH2_9MAGN|nr:hypothetical protein GIB67_025474 [Kingdonia uniflora]
MASGVLEEGSIEKDKLAEIKVYIRKNFKNPKNPPPQIVPETLVSQNLKTPSPIPSQNPKNPSPIPSQTLVSENPSSSQSHQEQEQEQEQPQQQQEKEKEKQEQQQEEKKEQQDFIDVVSDDSSSLVAELQNTHDPPFENGLTRPSSGFPRIDNNLVRIDVSSSSKQEIREVRQKLTDELYIVRNLAEKVEAKDLELNGYARSQLSPTMNTGFGNGGSAKRGNSEVGSVGHHEPRSFHSQLSPLSPTMNPGFGNGSSAKRGNSEVGSVGHHEPRPFHLQLSPLSPTMNPGFGNGGSAKRGNSEVGSVGHHEPRPFHSLLSPTVNLNPVFGNGSSAKRANSEVGLVGHHEPRPFRQLSVSVLENNHGGMNGSDFMEREKRTPKANQFYPNSEFLLGKDKFPTESKKSKSHSGKKHSHWVGGGEGIYGFGMERCSSQVFKNCTSLLSKLMKHKHGWVFNTPVDVKALGLLDYYTIIKHPMDLGTVKGKLSKNWYKTPRDFAEDVRLTFRNAMTYNPRGQDVHVMAEQLSSIFEERWAVIERELEYSRDSRRFDLENEYGIPTPTSKRTPIPPFHRILDRSESTTLRPSNIIVPPVRVPVPKKPKAKDLNKREMTYEEKQKLSTNLESLPPEKLENVVQIINKRNPGLCQQSDEIEVDIDVVDTETLWELDRFVTNFKKSLSKYKRRAELAQERELALKAQRMNPVQAAGDAPKETKTAERNMSSSSLLQGERQGDNASRSSSSSSSSSGSGSSSSDSDSDSSSASEAAQSPKS